LEQAWQGLTFRVRNFKALISRKQTRVGANLRGANLGRDNLGGPSQLQDATLEGAILDLANLEGAEYSERTIFPKGFDPEKHKMTLRVPKSGR
jgi:uncharacterized protein YjbI with pentapeptide repeats